MKGMFVLLFSVKRFRVPFLSCLGRENSVTLRLYIKKISSNLHIITTPPPHLCVCVCVCVCAISCCTFLYLQYIYLYHTCVLKSEFGHVWLLTTGFFTEIAVCKFLRGWRSYGLKLFYFVHCMCLYIKKNAAFCTAHCALDLARDHAP